MSASRSGAVASATVPKEAFIHILVVFPNISCVQQYVYVLCD